MEIFDDYYSIKIEFTHSPYTWFKLTITEKVDDYYIDDSTPTRTRTRRADPCEDGPPPPKKPTPDQSPPIPEPDYQDPYDEEDELPELQLQLQWKYGVVEGGIWFGTGEPSKGTILVYTNTLYDCMIFNTIEQLIYGWQWYDDKPTETDEISISYTKTSIGKRTASLHVCSAARTNLPASEGLFSGCGIR